jgi:hypothetical protein
MLSAMKVCSLLLLISLSVCANTQDPHAPATVSFMLDFPGANPSHYEIVVSDDGLGSYRSNGQLDQQSGPGDPAPLQFTLSPKVRSQIFDLAQRAHYFSGKVDSGRKNIANTGAKTLTYKDAQRNTQATYNYSQVAPVQQLTSIFQGLSTTLEFGRRLGYFHKYEKLALEQDLQRMEQLQKENSLGDVQAIATVLNEIANDQSVINVSRARALRLLATTGK